MTWTRSEIRRARHIPLVPILERQGYRLEPRPNGNYLVLGLAREVVVKDHYWVCTDDGSTGPVPAREAMSGPVPAHEVVSGNSIDFFVKIEGVSFNRAMEMLTS